jgi:nicotinate-nucleotide adenylyltransferase
MNKVGIFGGTFNPLHLGHINSVVNVAEKLALTKVFVIPAFQNPNKDPVEGPSPEQRLKMTEIGFRPYDHIAQVDDVEIQRRGNSYTVDTLKLYAENYNPEELHLIVGADAFYEIDTWKDYEEILSLCNVIVTSRPGMQLPFSVKDIPQGIQPLVALFDRNYVQLTTGRHIEFVRVEDVDVSATDIRKKLRNGLHVEKYLTFEVENFIKEEQLYRPLDSQIKDYKEFTMFCAEKLWSKKAIGLRGFDLSSMSAPTEYTLIASGTSSKHTSSIAEVVMHEIKDEYGVLPIGLEGLREGRWVLLDYGSLIIHLFYDFVRQEYGLENLWKEGKEIDLTALKNK